MRLTLRRLLVVIVLVGAVTLSAHWLLGCRPLVRLVVRRPEYGREAPLLFIGGVPRSGALTLSALLDLPCRPETHVIPRVLAMRQAWAKSGREKLRLDQAGVTAEVLDAALAAFVLQVLAQQEDQEQGDDQEVVHVQQDGVRTQQEGVHIQKHQLLCNQDPFALRSAAYLARIFPNSRFILMLRDGRAVVRSLMAGQVRLAGFDLRSTRDCLSQWSKAVEAMLGQCLQVGPRRCLPLRYEHLLQHPRAALHQVATFLGVATSPTSSPLRQQQQAILAKAEPLTDNWADVLPGDVVRDLELIAPMLRRLGYDKEPQKNTTAFFQ
ncbi:protein-tyrosine sulfotransferase 2 [Anolis sagrei]|uniref:protein-tyrosine sulfotransferase 2 n=1 Tax=Anolis sagrei TaxID=38937 RepID=UPI00295B1251|nr:protein-tyrosine sulfotransferase 2 [Anolis sagrei ordinatus]